MIRARDLLVGERDREELVLAQMKAGTHIPQPLQATQPPAVYRPQERAPTLPSFSSGLAPHPFAASQADAAKEPAAWVTRGLAGGPEGMVEASHGIYVGVQLPLGLAQGEVSSAGAERGTSSAGAAGGAGSAGARSLFGSCGSGEQLGGGRGQVNGLLRLPEGCEAGPGSADSTGSVPRSKGLQGLAMGYGRARKEASSAASSFATAAEMQGGEGAEGEGEVTSRQIPSGAQTATAAPPVQPALAPLTRAAPPAAPEQHAVIDLCSP